MTARVYLVRHARAGSRERWTESDRVRPLTSLGERQATAIARALKAGGVERLISSPFVRCVDTLRPFAETACLPIEREPALAEGATRRASLTLLRSLRGSVALCTHGDVIEDLLDAAEGDGLVLPEPRKLAKGSIWIFDLGRGGRIARARYRPAPPIGRGG